MKIKITILIILIFLLGGGVATIHFYITKKYNIIELAKARYRNQQKQLPSSVSKPTPSTILNHSIFNNATAQGSYIKFSSDSPIASDSQTDVTQTNVTPPGYTPSSGAFDLRPDQPNIVIEKEPSSLTTEFNNRYKTQKAVNPPVPESVLSPTLPIVNHPTVAQRTTITQINPKRYLFNNQAKEALSGNALVYSSGSDRVISKRHFAPPGESIDLVLYQDAVSSNNAEGGPGTANMIIASVWQPFYFQGRKLLDVGDKLMGTASNGRIRNRMLVRFQRIIFKSGRSLSIDAIAQDCNGVEGIPGSLQNADNLLPILSPIFLESTNAFLNSYKDRWSATTIQTSRDGQTEAAAFELTPGAQNSLHNGGISAAQGAVDKVANMMADELVQNRPYLLVKAGTRCQAFLTGYLDISNADFGQ